MPVGSTGYTYDPLLLLVIALTTAALGIAISVVVSIGVPVIALGVLSLAMFLFALVRWRYLRHLVFKRNGDLYGNLGPATLEL